MKSVKKQHVLGFLLIVLIGVGLLIGGIVRYKQQPDLVETQAVILGVETRQGDSGIEYRPFSVRYIVDGKSYETPVFTWFNYPLHSGDTINLWYKKDDPTYTVVSNVSRQTISFTLMGVGGLLIVAGAVLTGKLLYDANRRKRV